MSTPVAFTVAQLPAGFCWAGPQDYANALFGPTGIIAGSIPGNGVPVIVQASAPGPSFQGVALWGKLVTGFLEGVYWYSGNWFRPHPVPPSSQSRIIWMGSEAALWGYDGGDGNNPTGFPPTPTTGAMWQRDTTFGADDGSSIFKVPVGIGVNPTAYDGNPATTIGVGSTGGEERHKLLATESGIAAHTHDVAGFIMAPGSNFSSGGNNDRGPTVTSGVTGGAAPASVSHQNLSPYIGCIFAKRTARSMIQG